jgi:AcrR family transcriptional regulator
MKSSSEETRRRILDAARRILDSKGLSFATTKAIAKQARCAEGSIYTHFHDRAELLLSVFREGLPRFSDALSGLSFRVGEGTPEENLKTVCLAFLSFYRESAPLMGSLFSDLELLATYQHSLAASGKGPHTSQDHLVAYLKAEQRLGRVRADADLDFCAEIILGSCFQRAFRDKFLERRTRNKKDYSERDSGFASGLADAIARVIAPHDR